MQVYKITNLLTGKIYIGLTTQTLKERFRQQCKPHNKSKSYIGYAIQRYGKANFSIEVLAEYETLEALNLGEANFIQQYNSLAPNGYNLHTGGESHKTSEISKQKMSAAHTGKSSSRKGIKLSAETRLLIGQSKLGKPRPDWVKQKIAATNKGKKRGHYRKHRSRTI